MAWNLSVRTRPTVTNMNNKNRDEQVLDMVSPHVSQSTRGCCASPHITGDVSGITVGSPKRHISSAFDGGDDDVIEDNLHDEAQKKRRLTNEQVKFLEMSFEVENKLEPERKVLIAKQLGLQPRQVAVWFQNRRARWKIKQLERDYDTLKINYHAIVKENKALHEEIARLTALLRSDSKTIRSRPSSDPLNVNKSTDHPDGTSLDTPDGQYPTLNEPETVDESALTDKPELDSPTKSDRSEVLSSANFNNGMSDQKATVSSSFTMQDSATIPVQEALKNAYNPLFLQHISVKLESAPFSEDNCNFLFSWDDHGMFPWCDQYWS